MNFLSHKAVHNIYTVELQLLCCSTTIRSEVLKRSPRSLGGSRSADSNCLYVPGLPTGAPVPLHFVVGYTYAVGITRTHFPDSLSNFKPFRLCLNRYFRPVCIFLYILSKFINMCARLCVRRVRCFLGGTLFATKRPSKIMFHSRLTQN